MRGVWLLVLFAFLVAGKSSAQDLESRCERPIVLKEGTGLVGFDLAVDLGQGREGRRIEVGSFHPGDHRDGLSVSFGAAGGFEFGFALQLLFHQSRTTSFNRASGTEFGGFYAYGTYALLPFLGLEVGLQALSKAGWDQARVRRVALVFALPFKTILVPGRLALRIRPDMLVGFALKYYRGDEGPPQYIVFGESGLTLNITREFFLDLAFGIGKVLKGRDVDVQGIIAPGRAVFVPLSFQFGYSVTEGTDVAIAVSFPDLNVLGGSARYVTVSVEYRY